jgi:uncharacterized Fe-S cluster-containing radical SAM superfamily enzyme
MMGVPIAKTTMIGALFEGHGRFWGWMHLKEAVEHRFGRNRAEKFSSAMKRAYDEIQISN